MKIIISISISILLFTSCVNTSKKEKTVVAKWNFVQSDANNCDDDGSNSPSTCVFIYDGIRYLRGQSFKLNSNGNIDSIYSYHVPLGVNIYSLKEYGTYMMSLDTIGYNKMEQIQIKWDNKLNKILENNIEIDHTKKDENKIIVKKKAYLTIYELK